MKNKLLCLVSTFIILCSGCSTDNKNLGVAPHRGASSYNEGTFVNQLDISFPTIQSFDDIASDCQSVDPDFYNFQMWTTRDGLYCYVQQGTTTLKTDDSNQWVNTHTEFEIWNDSFGYGWDGTYVALFLDGTMYLNNTKNVKSYYYKHFTITEESFTYIEYYLYIDFDNNKDSAEQPYAYVKPYQCMPGEENNVVNSQVVNRDGRTLITGTEKSFQVHETIDAFMTT